MHLYTEDGTGEAVSKSHEKMSKSKYNGIDPMDVIKEYGADVARLTLLSDTRPQINKKFPAIYNNDTITGVCSWLGRIWLTVQEYKYIVTHLHGERTLPDIVYNSIEQQVRNHRNYALSVATKACHDDYNFAIAINKLQLFTKQIRKFHQDSIRNKKYELMDVILHSWEYERALGDLLLILSPMAPHMAAQCWEDYMSIPKHDNTTYKHDKTVFQQSWPKLDEDYELEVIVKINKHYYKDACKVRVGELETLTVDAAIAKAMENTRVVDKLHNYRIRESQLTLVKNCHAELNIMTEKPQQAAQQHS